MGIAELSGLTGLSVDTLRWYEREGVLPRVGRTATGRRLYNSREQGIVMLLTSLRDSGMPTAMMKEFVALLEEGAASHGRRITLMQQTQALLDERRARLDQAALALERKIDHYEQLIDAGLDCDGAPVPDSARGRQLARG
ncbi:MerR family transcriptional regulator [Leucobacter insecticola]|uniref:MerR family transcriptional regulator n=1 Tax=Leucobacter insecticola TaxID=2714934 RepID=UPI00197E27D0|nr:MerR family transcriptional regulator [Leucobacter insecticola]